MATELLRPFRDVQKRINRLRNFILGESEPSGDVEFLLSPGKIEQLVREGRPPLLIGTMGIGKYSFVMHPYYQVPPKGFSPDDLREMYSSAGGAYIFVNRLGVQRIGSTYTLTEEQSKEVEARIDAELTKLGKSRADVIHTDLWS